MSSDGVITLYDGQGRQIQMSRQEWATKVLPHNIQRAWNDPQQLQLFVLDALENGFPEAVIDAARQLVKLDPQSEQTNLILAIALMKANRLDESESIIRSFIDRHGESGTTLTNLAKVADARKRFDRRDEIMRRSLRLDPNQSNGLLWWRALQRERGGPDAERAALLEIASYPGAWRPQLTLAHEKLQAGEPDAAVAIYREILPLARDSHEAVMQIGGDLGNAGKLSELIELVAPIYNPEHHGVFAGANLLKAYIDTGNVDAARDLLHALQRLNRPDAIAHLVELERQLNAKESPQPIDPKQLEVSVYQLEMPLWQYGLVKEGPLFPPPAPNAPRIVLYPIADTTRSGEGAEAQREDDAGRLSRGIAMFLGEAIRFHTNGLGVLSLAFVTGGGPVLMGTPMSFDQMLANSGRPPPHVIISGTFEKKFLGGKKLVLTLWDAATRSAMKTLSFKFAEDASETALPAQKSVIETLIARRIVQPHASEGYALPGPDIIARYLSAQAQLLSQIAAAKKLAPARRLWNEPGILSSCFHIADVAPQLPQAKYIALASYAAALDYDSPVEAQFRPLAKQLLQQSRGSSKAFDRLADWIQSRMPQS